jgi:integrase
MHHLTQPQVKDLLRAIPNDRDRLCFLMIYLHGLRISEAVGGTSETRDKEGRVIRRVQNPPMLVKDAAGGYLTVPRLKGSNKTTHLLMAPSDPVLDEKALLEEVVTKHQLGPDDPLFPHCRSYYNTLMLEAGEKAGIPRHLCTPHKLKHSIAMHMVKKIDLKELQQYLGHRSLNSTAQYLHVTDAQASQAVVNVMEEVTK